MDGKVSNWYDGKTVKEIIEYCESLMMECDELRAQLEGETIPLFAADDYAEWEETGDGKESDR